MAEEATPSRWMVIALGGAVLAFVLAVVVIKRGPAFFANAEQVRLCRLLIPALYPIEDGIRILGSEAGSGKSVHVAFRMDRNDTRQHLLTCRFGGTDVATSKRDLVSVQLDGVGLGPSSFYFLKHGWLETPDALKSDPGKAS